MAPNHYQSTTAQAPIIGSKMPTTMPPAILRQMLLSKIPRPEHFRPARQNGETFEEYKDRRRNTNWWIGHYLKKGTEPIKDAPIREGKLRALKRRNPVVQPHEAVGSSELAQRSETVDTPGSSANLG